MPNNDNPEQNGVENGNGNQPQGNGGTSPPIRGWAAIFTRLIDFYQYLIDVVGDSPLKFHLAGMVMSLSFAALLAIVLAIIGRWVSTTVSVGILVVIVVSTGIMILFAVSSLLWLRTGWQTAVVKSLGTTEDKLIPFAASHQRNRRVIKAIAGEAKFMPDRYVEKWKEILNEFADALRQSGND